MNKCRFLLGIACVSMTAIGCATVEGYEQLVGQYIGKSSDFLVKEFGVPNRTIELKEGGEVFEYDRRRLTSTPGTCFDYPHHYRTHDYILDRLGNRHYIANSRTNIECSGPDVDERVCITRFIMDENNIVTDWTFEGDDCLAVPQSEGE